MPTSSQVLCFNRKAVMKPSVIISDCYWRGKDPGDLTAHPFLRAVACVTIGRVVIFHAACNRSGYVIYLLTHRYQR